MGFKSANWRRSIHSSAHSSSRAMFLLFVVFALLLSGLGTSGVYAESGRHRKNVHPKLDAKIDASPYSTQRVIIQWNQNQNPGDGDRLVRTRGGKKLGDVTAGGVVAELPAQTIRNLADQPGVELVIPDDELVQTTWVDNSALASIPALAVNADWAWQDGYSGKGVSIAIVDSGINSALSDFRTPSGANRVAVRKVFTTPAPTSLDGSGHGTLVAGIAAGNSWGNNNTTLRGQYMGIAPDATLIDLVVSDATGKSYTSSVVNAIDWAIANRVAYNIRVMNLSLVSATAESAKTSILAAAVERAWFNGIFVVAAAGNSGPNTMKYPPANDPFVMTVGANDAMGNWWADDDITAPWSSYGTTQDGYRKPDVVAPGRYAPGPVASTSSTLFKNFSSRALSGTNSTYMWMSGTSMAAPMVAGAAAAIFEKHPEWTNDQVKMVLATSAKPYGTTATDVASRGAGVIDLDGALWYPEYNGGASPAFANQGLKPSTMLTLSGSSTTYSSASWSSASWSSASWSSASWSSSSSSSASWSSSTGAAVTELQSSNVDLNLLGAPLNTARKPRK